MKFVEDLMVADIKVESIVCAGWMKPLMLGLLTLD